MDVKYRPEPWQNMGDGMNRITKDALMKLRDANESLKRIDGRIRDLDSDGSIHFNPKDQSQKIGELLDSYTTLQKYCGEVGRVVSEHIDKPFLVEMDKFAQKMRDTSILSFETNNRIGSTTTTVLPGAHAGYGSVPQTIQKRKDKITVEDIFRDSPAFDNVLRGEYKELKKQNPDAKLNYEEYKKVVPSTRGFEYKSIEDEQKKLEMIRDIGIGVGIIITTILCPPLGAAAAVVYGAVQIKSGIDGEDWGTHRKLSQEERVGNVIFGGLDAIPVVGAVGKGVKAFKGTSELADLAKLLKFKEGMPGFNPNLGKNVVQSLKENKTLKNALDAMKNTNIPVAVRVADTGMGVKLPYIESSTVGEVAGKFSKASTAAKDDAYQLAKGSGGSGVSKEGSVAKGTGEVKHLDDIPRIKEIEVKFNYKTKFDSEEFARQLKDQEKGMNELTVHEYRENRNRFIDKGRAIEGNAYQQAARERALRDKIDELFEQGLTLKEAKTQANEWMKTQAALHNPDQVAGGRPEIIGGMGDKRVNFSIGSQWRTRIKIVDKQIEEIAKNMTSEQLKNTYLNVKLTH
ncbi:polymorphic toxin type 15 domain-containing protein [Bacillus mycoides]|uniref:polymorphic toxin type 15 domain-containing protein n=1 Tax=Bacillus mycoides TaxID=1405 RepID=UPI000B4AADFE|nr:polymorphic toxin type 15 domain-containing protein [Bacillus mycoides]